MPETNAGNPSDAQQIDDLRALLAADSKGEVAEAVVDAEAAVEDPEAAADAVAVAEGAGDSKEAETGTVEKKQEPKKEEQEEDIPANVAKRIRKEVDRQAEYDRKIAEAVSSRKASEAKLAEVTKGSEPVKKTEATEANNRPVRPKMDKWVAEFTEKNGRAPIQDEWNDALADHEERLSVWFDAKVQEQAKVASKAIVEQELTARDAKQLERQREEASNAAWHEAEKVHGRDVLDGAVKTVTQVIKDETLQKAISSFDDWAGITVHLSKNGDALRGLADTWRVNPVAAIRHLTLLEQGLKPTTVTEKKTPAGIRVLPKPPLKIGGAAGTGKSKFDPTDMTLSDTDVLDGLRRMVKAG